MPKSIKSNSTVRKAGPKRRKAVSKGASRKSVGSSQSGRRREGTKIATLISLLSRKRGTTIADLAAATGWQAHSVRGAISGSIKKKRGLNVTSEAIDGRGRVYRIVDHG